MSILFDEIVFGPVKSRRLGVSLGINLLPSDYKYCSFDCIYCECGSRKGKGSSEQGLPSREQVRQALEARMKELHQQGPVPDAITFAGNGEPTIHPDFPAILEDTRQLRDTWFPDTPIGVLSNASMLHRKDVMEALRKSELNMLKLDAGTEETFRLINRPPGRLSLGQLIDQMKSFNGGLIIQSMFRRGTADGVRVDNTTDEEVEAWARCLEAIKPQYVMIYSIDRDTPLEKLEKVPFDDLLAIGARAEMAGIPAKVYG